MSPRPAVFNVALLVVCILCYYNALQCGFVFDDIKVIKENRDLRPQTPLSNLFVNDFWGTPMHKDQSHKSYRPLCVLTFRWNYFLHQLQPMGYHLINVLLHSIVCVLYFSLSCMFLPKTPSFIGATLFAVHPIHTEAVTGVVGRAETLSAIFFLAAILTYAKCTGKRERTVWRHMLRSVVLLGIAMLCKEQGITAVGVVIVYEVFVVQKLRLWEISQLCQRLISGKGVMYWFSDLAARLSVLVLSTVALLLVRVHIMWAQLPVFTRFDNPASFSPFPTRYLTFSYLWALNAWLLIFPCDLCCDWTMGTVPLIHNVSDPRNIATIVLIVTCITLGVKALKHPDRRMANVILISLSMIIFPFLPASNIFFPVGFVVAERVLYIPSMGYCMLVAQGWEIISTKRNSSKLAWLGITALLVAHGCKTAHRNHEWESEYSIFISGLKVNQLNAKLFNNVGHALEGQGNFSEALWYFKKAVSIQRDDIGAHINVGRALNQLGMLDEAEEAYVQAKSLLPQTKPGDSYQAQIIPNHLNVYLNLANLIARNETRLEEADGLYRQAISMRVDYTQAYINRGGVLLKMNKTKEAQEIYERALFYDRSNPDIYYNLGVVHLDQGKATQALAYLDKALEFDPEHEQALYNSAILMQEMGKQHLRKVAKERFLLLLLHNKGNEKVYFNLGMLAMDESDLEAAEEWFRKAVEVKEDFSSALFNVALLLSDSNRPLEAAPFLNQLLKYHPDHTNGLILLGDIYFNNIKDLESAEMCYNRILSVDPENIQALHNLCVVYVEREELVRAERCLSHVHQLAPHKEYIFRHLKIVRSRLDDGKQEDQIRNYECLADGCITQFPAVVSKTDKEPIS